MASALKLGEAEQALVNISNVTYVSPNQDQVNGTLRVTNFRLHFDPAPQVRGESRHWLFQDRGLFDVPLGTVEKLSRVASNQVVGGRGKDSLTIHIVCKDFRKLQFRFASVADACKIHDLVRMSAFPLSEGQGLQWLFAIEYGKAHLKAKPAPTPGWAVFDPIQEWIREGLFSSEREVALSDTWRVSEVNMDYRFCPSYPRLLAMPRTVTDDDLQGVGAFRSKARIPALSYFYRPNNATIWRSSQPKVGIGNTCRQDELLWASVLSRANSSHARIVDCRPFKNALGNKAKGMGYEDEMRYERTSISFLNIQNIHVTRSSYDKLLALVCSQSSGGSATGGGGSPGHGWLGAVEATGWLNHLRAILNASLLVARFVAYNGFPVLVHCSDGWDRTSQVVALGQMLVDPFFRTIKGFQVVVEKDWLSFGYKFMQRTGHGSDAGGDERSPCFLQFIDCVWQLLSQFPTMFEFNEAFLLCILEHLYSCKFGTFLYDCERERRAEHAVHQKTVSLWDHVDANVSLFTNLLFDVSAEPKPLLPHPSAVNRQVVLWSAYYLRFASQPSLTCQAFSHLRAEVRYDLPDAKAVLEHEVRETRNKIAQLEAKIVALRSSVTALTMGGPDKEAASSAEPEAQRAKALAAELGEALAAPAGDPQQDDDFAKVDIVDDEVDV